MKRTILVVDDSAGIREMLQTLLVGAGYEVITADTYEHAKDEADYADPDLLLIDVRLGDYNGLQIAVRERARGRPRPLIVMSGYDDPVLIAEAQRLGAEFLPKPIDSDALLAMIERMLAR
jgi:two-component system, NtrC family, nitrogen regulation response regulator NtrX